MCKAIEIGYTDIIKVKFVRHGEPSGQAYTYFTAISVSVGDMVELESKNGKSKGVVTEIKVPFEEIAPFKDKAKYIVGKWEDEPVQKIQCDESCDNFCYIGKGDTVCMKKLPPVLILDDWQPTDDFAWCESEKE